jgi:hypothetical protein
MKLILNLSKFWLSTPIYITAGIAANRNTPSHVLEQLAHNNYFSTRSEVASNPNSSTEALVSVYSNMPQSPGKGRGSRRGIANVYWGLVRHPNSPDWLKAAAESLYSKFDS